MNRSSRDSALPMQNSLQHRRGRSLSSVVKERDDDLALFYEMRKREKERNSLLLPNSDEFEPSLAATKSGSSPLYKITASTPTRKGGPDDLLNADGDKNDYDWLLTPPGTPLFPSLEMETQAPGMGQRGTPMVRPPPVLRSSRLSNPQTEPSLKARSTLISRQATTSSGLNNSTNTAGRRPSMSTSTGQVSSRPSTPTSRSTVPASRSAVPASRSAVPASRSAAAASRPSTPTSRSAVPASRPTGSASRSSTPTARSTIPASRPSSRPSTPTRRPSTPTTSQNNSAPPCRSSSVGKASSMPSRSSAPSRGSSPTVKSRPWQPAAMPGFSLDAPPNLRTTMPERPVSATRGRPGAPSVARSTTEAPSASSRPRRQSCSPSVTRGRISSDSQNSDRSSVQSSKSHCNGNDATVPSVLGSKMVEKVINARRSFPQRQEDQVPTRPSASTLQNKRTVKSISSPDSTGFGRTLSKKSLDMALRHMDIRRSTPSSLRPLMTNIPTASLYSVRSGASKSRTASISDSPIATSSNASSEHSVSIVLGQEGSELDDDDFGSERGSRTSPASQQGSIRSKGELASTNWLHSPEFREDKYDREFLFSQGFDHLSDPLEGVASVTSGGADYDSKIRLEY
eukprot:Gb_23642 [translate_table: standard]